MLDMTFRKFCIKVKREIIQKVKAIRSQDIFFSLTVLTKHVCVVIRII